MTFTAANAVALAVFFAAVAGATYGVQTLVDDRISGSLLSIEPLHERQAATGGHDVTFAVELVNRDDVPRSGAIRAEGEGLAAESDVVTVPAGGAATAFLTFSVPQDAAAGERAIDLRLVDEAGATLRQRDDVLRLDVLAGGDGFGEGDAANLSYIGILQETGRVFEANDPALADASFDRASNYQFYATPLRVTTPRPQGFPPGLYAGIQGMLPGESRTITLAPEEAYGAATLNTSRPREETIERTLEVPLNELPPLPVGQFQNLLSNTGQGRVEEYEVGDRFFETDPDTGNKFWFRITALSNAGVTRKFDPSVGEQFTTVGAWPNATVVVDVNESTASFRIDPPVAEGEPFTFYDYWPDRSEIVSLDDEEIVIRHSPDVGMSNEVRDPTGQSVRRFTVERLTDDEIVLRYPSPNPLAGKALVYHVTLLDLRAAS